MTYRDMREISEVFERNIRGFWEKYQRFLRVLPTTIFNDRKIWVGNTVVVVFDFSPVGVPWMAPRIGVDHGHVQAPAPLATPLIMPQPTEHGPCRPMVNQVCATRLCICTSHSCLECAALYVCLSLSFILIVFICPFYWLFSLMDN